MDLLQWALIAFVVAIIRGLVWIYRSSTRCGFCRKSVIRSIPGRSGRIFGARPSGC